MTRSVWVIEMRLKGEWEPCSDCALTRSDARDKLKDWKSRCPDDRFRVVEYVPRKQK